MPHHIITKVYALNKGHRRNLFLDFINCSLYAFASTWGHDAPKLFHDTFILKILYIANAFYFLWDLYLIFQRRLQVHPIFAYGNTRIFILSRLVATASGFHYKCFELRRKTYDFFSYRVLQIVYDTTSLSALICLDLSPNFLQCGQGNGCCQNWPRYFAVLIPIHLIARWRFSK